MTDSHAARTLSSSWTFFYKYLSSGFWIVGFGAAMAVVFLNPGRRAIPAMRDGAPTEAFWLFLVVGVLGAVINVALCAPLKEVRLENDELVVSNFRQEWRVPLSLVTDVTQNRWINLRPITVRLRSDVGFGTRIVFLPPVRVWRWPLDNDPEVNELRRMVGLSTRVS